MHSDVAAVALATVDETAGGESDEEDEEAEVAEGPGVDQEEENLLAVQRINMQRRMPVTEDDFRDAYPADKLYEQLMSDWNHDTKGPRIREKWSLVDDMLFRKRDGQTRKYVPESLRVRIMNVVHDSDYNMHAGRDQTLQDLKARYYWPDMDHDVSEYVKRCIWCRKAKTVVPTRAGFLQQTLHQHDGYLLSIDLVGPLRLAKGGYNYILTVLDAFSHKLIAVPINSKSATSVLDAFTDHVVLQGLLPSRLVSAFSSEEPVQNLVQNRRGRGRKIVHRKGRIVSDNGREFKNQLFRTILKQFEIRFGYSIPYHPQSNPVERVHRYINDLLRIAIDRSDSVYDHWTEPLPYIVFSYNKRYINGTKISPFMLRNGFQPRYPEDFQRDEFRCADKTFQQRLDDRIARYQACEKAVYEANEVMKAKNKVQYDAHQYSQEYEVGDKVLHHCSAGLDKLHLRWHGPFEIVEKISPVKYVLKDPLDGQLLPVSIQQITLFVGEYDADEGDDELVAARSKLHELRLGQYIAFRRWDDEERFGAKSKKVVHVGEIIEEYNRITGAIKVHHYVDLGPTGRWDPAKPLHERRVYPEMVDSRGRSYTVRGRMKEKPNSDPQVAVYKFIGQERIKILAYNWNLQTGGKILADVCIKVQKAIEQDIATANTTVDEEPVEYRPGVWDTEPRVRHDLEQYRAVHSTICFDPFEKVYWVSKRQ
mmetsp:Transcript_20732/g.61869  ORF Transcript_20732/g.61869 Transcript_20732/m.61869 type:complete len:706 (+) Transcript_20732:1048-3165(+)